ncbi:hypothetical protein EG68_11535 [Paragonimus skrjabini miyazakii]|uniref:Secreted protein n=1 Tax=Paragonimus skrjabini miyazakii TaxID=59628 RepID=A0A8S9YCH7_9TREM|nr:hypothetical protein EG68_11535 [Paragonimus skrjabini miyazakii]
MSYWAFGSRLFLLSPFTGLSLEPLLQKNTVPRCLHVAQSWFTIVTGTRSQNVWLVCYICYTRLVVLPTTPVFATQFKTSYLLD